LNKKQKKLVKIFTKILKNLPNKKILQNCKKKSTKIAKIRPKPSKNPAKFAKKILKLKNLLKNSIKIR